MTNTAVLAFTFVISTNFDNLYRITTNTNHLNLAKYLLYMLAHARIQSEDDISGCVNCANVTNEHG